MGGVSPFRSLGFLLVWADGVVDDVGWQNSIQLLASRYVDIDGNPMPELSASMQKIN